MKKSFFGWLALGLTLALSPAVQAQGPRPGIMTDAEFNARAAREARERSFAQEQESLRLAMTTREIQSLQDTTNVLVQSFSSHCKMRKISAASAEGELLRALTDLQTDVTHLANDVYGRCGKTGRVELAHVYRTFHLTEYASRDAQTLAAQAGYVRSLGGYFQDIDSHIAQLGQAGFRNPRLRRIEMETLGGRGSVVQERPISLPPIPRAQPMPPAPVPGPKREKEKDEKIDIGDVLKQLFRDKLR